MDVIPYSHGEGKYEVTGPNEYVPVVQTQDGTMSIIHRRFQYIVTFGPERIVECTCRGIQLTGIPCAHVLAVCRHNSWSPDQFVAHWYRVDYLLSTWNALFVPYGNPEDWLTITTPKIEPNTYWIRRGRREHIRQVMTMDEMQGRRMGHRPRRSTSYWQSRDAHNAENERAMAEASGSQGSRRSTSRSRTADRESANMMFREAMGEVLTRVGAVWMQGSSGTTQRRRSTSGARSSGTAHLREGAVQPPRMSTSQVGPSGTSNSAQKGPSGIANWQEKAVQPARMSTSSWGSGQLLGLHFRLSGRSN